MKSSLGISNFLEEISSLSHSIVFLYFFALITEEGCGCSSDHEVLIAKLRLKLNKVWKTTRPFRYDPDQIPYDYTVEVRNRLKGLYLVDRVPEELWTEIHDIVQETGIKTILKKMQLSPSVFQARVLEWVAIVFSDLFITTSYCIGQQVNESLLLFSC